MAEQTKMNIVDEALELAVGRLGSLGMPQDEAHIALLIRLWDKVPEEIVEVAKMLQADEQVTKAVNG